MSEKDNEYALDTFTETAKKDPLRLLDVENDTQMVLSKLGAPSETERARSNYNKLVYNEPRPVTHHLTEFIGRLLPNLAAVGGAKLVKLTGSALKKGAKDFAKKLATSKLKRAALKKAQKGLGTEDKTVIKSLTSLFKNDPQRVRDAIDLYEKNGLKTIADKIRAFDTTIDGVVHSRFKKIPGSLTTKYNTILNDVPDLSKQTKIPEDEIVKAIKREADRAFREPKFKKLNFIDNKLDDMRNNPDLYKGLTDEETDILFKNRKDKYLDIEKSTAFFNTGLDNVVYATGDELVPDIIKKAPKFFGKAGAAEIKLHAPRLADLVHDKVFYQKPVEKEFKKYTFDKQPDTHPVLDLIGDIIGVDYYNPNRWNKEDVEWFLNKAYEKGLFSNKDWTRWTPRQKVLKMKEIVQSPMAANFMKELRGTE